MTITIDVPEFDETNNTQLREVLIATLLKLQEATYAYDFMNTDGAKAILEKFQSLEDSISESL